MEKNHKPLFILNLEIDPEQIDINVHPQKHEVKFEDERLIYNTLRKAVTMGLQEYDLTPAIELIRHQVNSPFELSSDDQSGDSFIVNKITGELIEQTPVRQFEMSSKTSRKSTIPKIIPKEAIDYLMALALPKKK